MSKRSYDGNSRGGGRYANKRPRYEEPKLSPEEEIQQKMINVGDKPGASVESELDDLSRHLDEKLTDNKDLIIKTLCECVAELPEKTTFYSTLVGLLNVKNYSFGGEVVELLVKSLKDYLVNSDWNKSRSLIRFLGDLVNCHVISAGSLLNLFENLAEVTMEDNIPQVRSDFYVFCVLSSLPWVGKELHEKKEQDLDQLLNNIEGYITKRSKVHHPALRVWYSDSPHPQEEYLDCLWAQISKLRQDQWMERHIFKPYQAFDSVISEALQHNLPQIAIPPHDASTIYPYPKVVFRLFDYTDCPEGPVLPGAHSIERFLIEESINNIIVQYYYQRKDCASNLVGYPTKHKYPWDYMMVEVVLGKLFALPVPTEIEVFYGALLLELCKLQPSTLPQVLAQSVELLFDRLETMNAACVDRFATWFAYHLSNYQFRWNWEDWSACATLDALHPKSKFIREALVRCMRLSYHQRISDLPLPESFQGYIPEPPLPRNKYAVKAEAEVAEDELSAPEIVKKALQEKASPDEILEKLSALSNPSIEYAEPMEESAYSPHQIDVFVTVLLNAASKSFTHLFSAVGKFQSVLKTLCVTDDGQLCLLRTVFDVWRNHQQLIVVLVEKLVKADIVSVDNVANWIFSTEMSEELMRSYVWEILFSSIRKKAKMVIKQQKDIAGEKQKLAKFEAEDIKAALEDMDEIPSEDTIERAEEVLDTYQSDLKNLFLIIFQRFTMLLSEHIQKCEAQGKTFKNYWFRWIMGRLQQVLFEFHVHTFNYVPTLKSLVFTNELDQHVLLIFKQFCSLRA